MNEEEEGEEDQEDEELTEWDKIHEEEEKLNTEANCVITCDENDDDYEDYEDLDEDE